MKAFLTRLYLWMSWALFFGGIICWPLSQFTVAKDEPPFILGLSWLAIIVSSLSAIIAADVRKEQDD
jgi:FtsH-binding integral membrane protein